MKLTKKFPGFTSFSSVKISQRCPLKATFCFSQNRIALRSDSVFVSGEKTASAVVL